MARSHNPYGPFIDSMGNDMINAKGLEGTLFHDPSIEPYGTKLIGNYRFLLSVGEPGAMSVGYVSPGHSSAYFDESKDKYFLFFHTRFKNRGETHYVRVHQFFFNDEGWPVIAPYRYSGEMIGKYTKEEITGVWKLIDHGRDITADVKESAEISLNSDGSVSGAITGKWKVIGGNKAEFNLNGTVYKGVFLRQWDTNNSQNTMTFTVLSSEKGIALWGSKVIMDANR